MEGAPYGFTSLRTRIMVAAGGGGATTYHAIQSGGYGGTTTGGAGEWGAINNENSDAIPSTGATQTKGGRNGQGSMSGGDVAYGSFGTCSHAGNQQHAGGGNGYFAGGNGGHSPGRFGSGSGGSSFISGHSSCSAITEASTASNITFNGHNHFSGMVFTNMSWAAGNQSMPNPRGSGNITGNTGNGYARITLSRW